MAFSVNKIILLGNLGKDADMRYSGEGKAFTRFSMATAESWKGHDGEWEEKTTWHNVIAFGNLAEWAGELARGDKVYVEGRIEHREFENEDGEEVKYTQVVAMRIIGLNPKEEGGAKPKPKPKKRGGGRRTKVSGRAKSGAGKASEDLYGEGDGYGYDGSDDDLPF